MTFPLSSPLSSPLSLLLFICLLLVLPVPSLSLSLAPSLGRVNPVTGRFVGIHSCGITGRYSLLFLPRICVSPSRRYSSERNGADTASSDDDEGAVSPSTSLPPPTSPSRFLSRSSEAERSPSGISEEEALQAAKAKRTAELKAQEVFIQRPTGRHECRSCGYVYDEARGDTDKIGGTNAPGTSFEDLPANFRCAVCRASKDQFSSIVEEIPGFEVNQGE